MNPAINAYLTEIRSKVNHVSQQDFKQALLEGALSFDIREPQEHSQGVIAGAIAIPRGVLEFTLFNLPMLKNISQEEALNTPIYLYCASGGRSTLAAHSLQEIGFTKVYSVVGGIKQWLDDGGQVIKP